VEQNIAGTVRELAGTPESWVLSVKLIVPLGLTCLRALPQRFRAGLSWAAPVRGFTLQALLTYPPDTSSLATRSPVTALPQSTLGLIGSAAWTSRYSLGCHDSVADTDLIGRKYDGRPRSDLRC